MIVNYEEQVLFGEVFLGIRENRRFKISQNSKKEC